jgi:hypothetical protein
MYIKALSTVVALTIAAPAFANPGTDQLALSLGVQPGTMSLSELVQLDTAVRDNDQAAVNFILSKANGASTRSQAFDGSVNAGEAQIAAQAGVKPGTLSTPDMIALIEAKRTNDDQAVKFILSGSNDNGAESNTGSVTPGKAQLAAALGVDPAAYTTADLWAMYRDDRF